MAQKVITLCDLCAEQGDEVDGSTVSFGIDGLTGLVDLCPEHQNRWAAPIRDMLENVGRELAQPKPKAKPKTKTIRNGELTLQAAAAAALEEQQASEEPAPEVPYPCFGCTVMGHRQVYRSPTPLGNHTLKAHGLDLLRVHEAVDHCRVSECGKGSPGAFRTVQELATHAVRVHSHPTLAAYLTWVQENEPEQVKDLADLYRRSDPGLDPAKVGAMILTMNTGRHKGAMLEPISEPLFT